VNQGRTVFSQIIEHLPDRTFRRIVARYEGNRRVRSLACWDHYLCMTFAQVTYRESLRDIEAGLRALGDRIYIAVTTYVPMAIVRKRLGIELELYTLLQIRSVYVFEKVPLPQLLSAVAYTLEIPDTYN
jgi:hypothetical protein